MDFIFFSSALILVFSLTAGTDALDASPTEKRSAGDGDDFKKMFDEVLRELLETNGMQTFLPYVFLL